MRAVTCIRSQIVFKEAISSVCIHPIVNIHSTAPTTTGDEYWIPASDPIHTHRSRALANHYATWWEIDSPVKGPATCVVCS